MKSATFRYTKMGLGNTYRLGEVVGPAREPHVMERASGQALLVQAPTSDPWSKIHDNRIGAQDP